jgi:hypothetical protein
MARIKLVDKPVAKKQQHPRLAKLAASGLSADEKYLGPEPVWDTERAQAMPDDEFNVHLRRSLRWYSYMYSSRELKKYVIEWMQGTGFYSQRDVKVFIKSNDQFCPITLCSLVVCNLRGMPFREQHLDYMHKTIRQVIDDNQDLAEPEERAIIAPAVKVTIADRVAEKTSEIIGEIEGKIDEYLFQGQEFNLYEWLRQTGCPQGSVVKVRHVVTRQQTEFQQAAEGSDAQLKEAYRGFAKAKMKKVLAFYEKLMADLDAYTQTKKVERKARVKKSPSKDKLVSKMRYLKEDKTLKITSVNPVDIVGASKLWVYNTKTRKLYRYQAEELTGTLTVKGTTIVGYDEVKSVGKTVRKPAEVLAKFMKASKVQLRKFLDDINAVEARANGRINEDCVLLKVE